MISLFTDYLAACLRITLKDGPVQRGRGLWKMNMKLLEDTTRRIRIQPERTRWKLQEGKYPDKVTWLKKYVERNVHFPFHARCVCEASRIYDK